MYFSDCFLLLNASNNVSVPTLPINIDKIRIPWPAKDISAVIPVLNPVVEKADICSNIRLNMFFS